ncbi:MFS transporter [Fructobacillus sp. M158]|uniref:MFS transporter n=1 Tax=Fructobacillus parabroussonetiae TaxID=2713174 RepID=UPI00200AE26F|nr:MFS transporter [Fructobacillus parabroussonetiae]MCK8617626.1 MFS transporter [Fructobacillus parabroussonetiae]
MQISNFRLKFSLFLNYFVHGCGLIILTQNLTQLASNWHSTLATASFVLSGIGIGRLAAYLSMGFLSDKVGRKKILLFGMLSYLIFFIASPVNESIPIAYGLSILAGIANSALDSATYPILSELRGNQKANSISLKAFMSSAEFILPVIVLTANQENWWFGLSFLLPAVILMANLINVTFLTFPKSVTKENENIQKVQLNTGKKVLVTAALLLYGYTSMAVMIWFTQWISIFAKNIDFGNTTAHLLLSLYSLGSISGVLLTLILLRIKAVANRLFLFQNILSLLSLIIIAFSTQESLSMVACFTFGFSAAAGLMQMALATLLRLYPKKKGLLTGLFFSFGSLASFTVPLITGWLVAQGKANLMVGDVIVALIGLAAALIIQAFFPKEAPSLKEARKVIDRIDHQLLRLVEKRFQAVDAVIALKQKQELPVLDASREEKVLEKIAKNSHNKALISYNQAIWQTMMAQSRAYQRAKAHHNNKE